MERCFRTRPGVGENVPFAAARPNACKPAETCGNVRDRTRSYQNVQERTETYRNGQGRIAITPCITNGCEFLGAWMANLAFLRQAIRKSQISGGRRQTGEITKVRVVRGSLFNCQKAQRAHRTPFHTYWRCTCFARAKRVVGAIGGMASPVPRGRNKIRVFRAFVRASLHFCARKTSSWNA